jgi:hypothetical protein
LANENTGLLASLAIFKKIFIHTPVNNINNNNNNNNNNNINNNNNNNNNNNLPDPLVAESLAMQVAVHGGRREVTRRHLHHRHGFLLRHTTTPTTTPTLTLRLLHFVFLLSPEHASHGCCCRDA